MTSSVYPDPDEPRRRAAEARARANAEAVAALGRLLESYRSDPTLGPYIEGRVHVTMERLADLGTIMYRSDREKAHGIISTLVAEVIRDMTIHQSHS